MHRAFSPQGENRNRCLRSPAGFGLVARPPPTLAGREGLQFGSAPPLDRSTRSPTSRRRRGPPAGVRGEVVGDPGHDRPATARSRILGPQQVARPAARLGETKRVSSSERGLQGSSWSRDNREGKGSGMGKRSWQM